MLASLRHPSPSHVRARETKASENPRTEPRYIHGRSHHRSRNDRWSSRASARKTIETANAPIDEMKWASRNPDRYGPSFRATDKPETAKLVARSGNQSAISGRRKLEMSGGLGVTLR